MPGTSISEPHTNRLAIAGLWPEHTRAEPLVRAVDPVEITVADMERSLAFYEQVLRFKKLLDVEVHGPEYEHFQGVFGLRMRMVRLQIGQEMR